MSTLVSLYLLFLQFLRIWKEQKHNFWDTTISLVSYPFEKNCLFVRKKSFLSDSNFYFSFIFSIKERNLTRFWIWLKTFFFFWNEKKRIEKFGIQVGHKLSYGLGLGLGSLSLKNCQIISNKKCVFYDCLLHLFLIFIKLCIFVK